MISLNTTLSLVCVTALGGISAIAALHDPPQDDYRPVTVIPAPEEDPWMDVILSDDGELDDLVAAQDVTPVPVANAVPSWETQPVPVGMPATSAQSRNARRDHDPRPATAYRPFSAVKQMRSSRSHGGGGQSRDFFKRSRTWRRNRDLDRERMRHTDHRINQSRIVMPSRIAIRKRYQRDPHDYNSLFQKTRAYQRNGSVYPMSTKNRRGRRNRQSFRGR